MSILQAKRRGHIAFGFILTAFAIGLIYWNEVRSARMDDALNEGYKQVTPAKVDQLNPNNEGKLIHLIGSAVAGGPALDPDVGIQAQSVSLIESCVHRPSV